jgi:hypothetical protein
MNCGAREENEGIADGGEANQPNTLDRNNAPCHLLVNLLLRQHTAGIHAAVGLQQRRLQESIWHVYSWMDADDLVAVGCRGSDCSCPVERNKLLTFATPLLHKRH